MPSVQKIGVHQCLFLNNTWSP